MPNFKNNAIAGAAALGLLGGCGGPSEEEIRHALQQVETMIEKQQKNPGAYQNQEELGKLKAELERQLGEIAAAKSQ